MTTLIHVSNSDGTVGRCDERCYLAAGEDCTCICGGMNHGKGKAAAMDATRNMCEKNLEILGSKGGFIADEIRQQGLF